MSAIKHFLKKEPVFVISFAAAIISAFFVPPSMDYVNYVKFDVLELLFCLICVVAGLRGAGVISFAAHALVARAGTSRRLAAALTLLCFFSSMLMTNDVALITFVPITLTVFAAAEAKTVALVIVLETAAANLGSMATPVGNPQNLFLYSNYSMSAGAFFGAILPLAGVSLVILLALLAVFRFGEASKCAAGSSEPVKPGGAALFGALFVLCLASVFKLLNIHICTAAVALAALVYDRRLFRQVDWLLLLTFLCFFIFSGNISRFEAVKSFVTSVLVGNETLVGALTSQVISNVPAAMLLAPFTPNGEALMRGVDIGGMGTPVASLASLISYRIYCASEKPARGRFMAIFFILDFAMLAALLLIERIIY